MTYSVLKRTIPAMLLSTALTCSPVTAFAESIPFGTPKLPGSMLAGSRTFSPDTYAVRAEAAIVLQRMSECISSIYLEEERTSKMKKQASSTGAYTDYTASDYDTITLKENAVLSDSSSAEVSGSTVTITKAGTYVIEGAVTDGMVIIDTVDSGIVRLVLNNAAIASQSGSPIYVKNAGNVIISLPAGTASVLTDSEAYTHGLDTAAALYSTGDLWINGSGALIEIGRAHV